MKFETRLNAVRLNSNKRETIRLFGHSSPPHHTTPHRCDPSWGFRDALSRASTRNSVFTEQTHRHARQTWNMRAINVQQWAGPTWVLHRAAAETRRRSPGRNSRRERAAGAGAACPPHRRRQLLAVGSMLRQTPRAIGGFLARPQPIGSLRAGRGWCRAATPNSTPACLVLFLVSARWFPSHAGSR